MSETSDATWEARLTQNPRWDTTLRRRGANAVQRLVDASPGKGPNSEVPGLGDANSERPTRAYAESWLDEQSALKEARKERREDARNVLTWAISILAIVVAAGSMVSNFYSALHK
jgi:hypothetical protein